MTTSPTTTEPDTMRDAAISNDRERELSRELAKILKRAPTKARRKTDRDRKLASALGPPVANLSPPDPAENDPDLTRGAGDTPPGQAKSSPPPRDEEPDAPGELETAADYQDLDSTILVKTTRRARMRKGASQAGAWLITFSVTGFIIGCVSIMLLGLPKTLNPTAWLSATAPGPSISTPAAKSQQPDPQTPAQPSR